MKREFLFGCGCVGLFVAILLAGVRLYMLYHEPQYQDVMYGGWFDTITLILWPGAFYLTVMQSKEPVKIAFFVWTVAVLLNPAIYAIVGWSLWRLSRAVKPREDRANR